MRIAICGGIGSGKSAVLEIIRKFGYATISADDISRELYSDEKYTRLVSAAFPEALVNGKIDKKILSDIIFTDKAKRIVLNSISHPMIKLRMLQIDTDPIFVELPLLIESGFKDDFDEIIFVKSKVSHRIKRLKEIRNMSKKRIKAIMKAQVSGREVAESSTVILNNTSDLKELEENVVEILEYLFK